MNNKEQKQKERTKYALHYAASSGDDVSALLVSLCHPKESDNWCEEEELDLKGRTPLHWAARNGHLKICEQLVEYKHQWLTVEDKSGIRPIELAVWQGHLSTLQYLLSATNNKIRRSDDNDNDSNDNNYNNYDNKLMSSSTSHWLNSYGCGLQHWCGLCVNHTSTSHEMVKYLHLEQKLNFQLSNHHGQTPLHKAAYSGNLWVLQYLLTECHITDDKKDSDGNSAADCAERAQRITLANFLRRHNANPSFLQALTALQLTIQYSQPPNTPLPHQKQNIPTILSDDSSPPSPPLSLLWPSPPPLSIIRQAYLQQARRFHPNKQKLQHNNDSLQQQQQQQQLGNTMINEKWLKVHKSYQLLHDWWTNPKRYDDTIRSCTRNVNIIPKLPLLLTYNDETKQQNNDDSSSLSRTHSSSNNDNPRSEIVVENDPLVLFQLRLLHLLQPYQTTGLMIDQLPKLYQKSYPSEILPKPKQYKCKKLVHFLRKHCSSTCRIEYSYLNNTVVSTAQSTISKSTPIVRLFPIVINN